MNSPRWRQIKQIYGSVLEREPEQREAFLDEACAGDQSLRNEVASLLAREGGSEDLFDSPALDVAAQALARDQAQEPRPDLTGQTLSHYRFLEKIGEGGMGVVYRAEDTRLKRSVALKLLPADRLSDPERKRRFVQEARAASALNHPNIVTIHDIDQAEALDFIAMEYVAGKTLDRQIPRKGMALDKVLGLGIQLADALAAAHAAGIIHRDLKPSNIMVKDSGQVKILDFGLAKLTERETSEADGTSALPATDDGMILGTVTYMSPEQAQGKKVDARSDIFSFGAVLYEMISGRRAFEGDSITATLAAIIRDEPKPLSQVRNDMPDELGRTIHRCLRKEPDRRFHSISDVKVELQEVREELESQLKTGQAPRPARRLRWVVPILVLVIALALVTSWWLLRPAQELKHALTPVPLTTYAGYEINPAFSPDGNQLVFQWNGEKADNWDIYVKTIGSGEALRLTSHPGPDSNPAWSPDGSLILFGRIAAMDYKGASFYTIPPTGGVERKVYETKFSGRGELPGRKVTWTPDSKGIVISEREADSDPNALFLVLLDTGEKRRLTAPPSRFNGDTNPAFSPDGRILSFSRMRDLDAMDLYLLHMTPQYQPVGEPQVLTDRVPIKLRNIKGQAWGIAGKEIVVSIQSGSTFARLWRVPVDDPASSTRLDAAGFAAVFPAFSQASRRLAFSVTDVAVSSWILKDPGDKKTRTVAQKFIPSTRGEEQCQVSPDGEKIAFMSLRSGAANVWVGNSNGSGLLMVTNFDGTLCGSPAWSPDGRSIAFDARPAGQSDIYAVSPEGGPIRQITKHASEDVMPSFSRDGRWMYFTSNRTGRWQVWKMPSSRGEAVQVTQDGGFYQQESVDGTTLFFAKDRYASGVYRMPVEGGKEAMFLPDARIDRFAPSARGYYFWRVPSTSRELIFLESSTGARRVVTVIEKDPIWFPSPFPDGQHVIYSQVDRASSDLYLIENFR
ncbi:MAG: serine/threonine-protein kinase [Acidobacteria bacterium]|nr:MAG: serine/threonine-protein kinase [Acidobacteriota bacterium]